MMGLKFALNELQILILTQAQTIQIIKPSIAMNRATMRMPRDADSE